MLSRYGTSFASFFWGGGQVITAYETQGYDMLEKAFNETGYLEKLTGLDKLYEEATAAMEELGLDEGDGDGDDF